MLLAVDWGRSQAPSLVLSRRRSMRRLRSASLRCTVAFTRNLSWQWGLENVTTFSNPGKAERFRALSENSTGDHRRVRLFKDWNDVREGMAWLARSAAGDELTRNQVEAGI